MNKHELFLMSITLGKYKRLYWRLAIFNIAIFPATVEPVDYDLNYIDSTAKYWLNGEWQDIDDAVKGEGLYGVSEAMDLRVGFWNESQPALVTTYGRMVANYTTYHYAFGPRFDYVNENITPDNWLKKHIHLGVDNDAVPTTGLYITADEISRLIEGCTELKVLAPFITSAGSARSLETHPDVPKVLAKRLKENKEQLHIASVVAGISSELDELDKEWLSGDHSIDFYNTKKSRVSRRKLLLMEGTSSAFREDGSFILQPNAITAGLMVAELVAKNNETREGSYQRGSETAKGGAGVTNLQSTFQNHRVATGDCGAVPLPCPITEENFKSYSGLNVLVGKNLVQWGADEFKANIGKTVLIRRAFLCNQAHIDVCESCANSTYVREPHAISNEDASIGSYMMYGAMSAMHASDLKVSEFIPKYHIT